MFDASTSSFCVELLLETFGKGQILQTLHVQLVRRAIHGIFIVSLIVDCSDYNSLLCGLGVGNNDKLQRIQNLLAQVFMLSRVCDT
jgi:hypothetical protein